MNTLYGSKRGSDWLELIARTSEPTITAGVVADYRNQYDYIELQSRDVEDVEYEVLDSWSADQ